jgi:hypothetical protein
VSCCMALAFSGRGVSVENRCSYTIQEHHVTLERQRGNLWQPFVAISGNPCSRRVVLCGSGMVQTDSLHLQGGEVCPVL